MGVPADRIVEFIDEELRNADLNTREYYEEIEEVIDNLQQRVDTAREMGEI